MSKHHDLFEEYLKENEGRYTSQKREIVDAIAKMKHHFEIEEFIEKVRLSQRKFSRATVYRVVKQLLDAGLIQKISTRDGKVYYEHNFTKRQHDHIICNSCGKISEIMEDDIGDFLGEYCEKIGFALEYRSLHLYGICRDCQG